MDRQNSREPLWDMPSRNRTSYAQMTRFAESFNPMAVIDDLDDITVAVKDGSDQGKPSEVSPNGTGGDRDDDHEDGDADTQDRSVQQDVQDPDVKGRKLFFKDGRRRIDYILAYVVDEDGKAEEVEEARLAREVFERNLVSEGLLLEYDQREGEAKYVKVHIPWEVLTRYAEILKVKVPVKKSLVLTNIQKKYAKLEEVYHKGEESAFDQFLNPMKAMSARLWATLTGMVKKLFAPFELDKEVMPPIPRRFTLPYSRTKEYLYDFPEDRESLFSVVDRSRIVNFILRRKAFSDDKNQEYAFGINKMIADEYYTAAYPLHEGHWKAGSAENERKRLYDHWANLRCFFKFQPLDHVRSYFGEKIGIYFTWLGFYTQMLIPASVVGLIVFIYGCAISGSSYPGVEICDEKNNFTMCPLCDYQCPYWNLHDTCANAKASRIFDNGGTVFFAIFMAFWGTLFLEFWKRKEATLQYRWDLTDFHREEQPPRPEYLAKLSNCDTYKIHPVTGMKEPYMPFWRKRFPIFLASYSVMLFMGLLAISAVIGVIAYRVALLAALQAFTRDENTSNDNSTLATTKALIYQNASVVTTITAACLNLLFIIILNMIYTRVAFWLTDQETIRTQKDYDDSITVKLFALQFVNYYSSIVYIAFFKGRILGRPGNYNHLFGGRQEECGSGGCLIELCIQLAIIMTGKQLIMNNCTEVLLPKIIKWIKRMIWKESKEKKMSRTPWEKDYKLDATSTAALFHEYLEMVLQFGFLTLFVAAFPLGPLFALLNNLLEIRFDAAKFITHLRRPLAERTPNIGVWYNILYGISRIAIISNAFIIALTSDFIPRLVYEQAYSPDGSLRGYTNATLSFFNTTDFSPENRPNYAGSELVELCRYRDLRNPPWSDDKYEFTEMYWHIFAARFVFVVVFENLIVVITGLIAYVIPDVPHQLKVQIRRENYISNEIVIKTEMLRAHGENVDDIMETIMDDEVRRYHTTDLGSMTLVNRKPGESPSTEV
ncbi:anoctamin-1-like isoform X2 [Ylistrum balloti]|uniref:anoctamin-1-like isoform X2 n=1 Tax=Ylistrum balloti TaxID=509963 RepID=UPI002905D720|nr:anoctamin-1-like isoform X2 [Ylistrum balloti]